MDEPGHVHFGVAYPPRFKRWLLFVRCILIIPHTIILAFLGLALGVVSFLACWAILFTGRYPEGMFSFLVDTQRWAYRVQLYILMLTDAYPPFSTGQGLPAYVEAPEIAVAAA
jgi:hypothetical protein